jgi:hypothetical protein
MIKSLKTTIMIAIIYAALIFAIYPVQGFVADHIDYSIHNNGDATVTADYTMNWGEQIALMVPTVKDQFSNTIKSEYGDKAEVISISDSHAQFTIPDYGVVTDTYVQSPYISFENIKSRIDKYWFMKYLDIDYSPTITTITFDNNKIYTYNDVMVIPAVTNI